MHTSASPHCGSSHHNNDFANHSPQDEEQKSRLHGGGDRVICLLLTFKQLSKYLVGDVAGGQKSKQEKKEAHKAKLKAKKGDDASAATTALLNSTPTAEALAAVGANQMSKAAAERQAGIDKNRLAWQQHTQAATSGAASANHAASAGPATAGAASDSQAISGAANAGDAPAASQVPAGHTDGPRGTQAESEQQVAGDAGGTNGSTSSSEEEEGEGETDTAGSGQVHGMHCNVQPRAGCHHKQRGTAIVSQSFDDSHIVRILCQLGPACHASALYQSRPSRLCNTCMCVGAEAAAHKHS